MHHDFPLTKSKIPLTVRSQFELEPEPQSKGASVPVWEAVSSSPHALQRSSSHVQAHMDHSTSRTPGQGVVIRLSGLTMRTSAPYLNLHRSFYLVYICVPVPGTSPESNRFLHRADQAWDFFLSHTKNAAEMNAFVQKEFSFQITGILWW